jgi:hypothetical protein
LEEDPSSSESGFDLLSREENVHKDFANMASLLDRPSDRMAALAERSNAGKFGKYLSGVPEGGKGTTKEKDYVNEVIERSQHPLHHQYEDGLYEALDRKYEEAKEQQQGKVGLSVLIPRNSPHSRKLYEETVFPFDLVTLRNHYITTKFQFQARWTRDSIDP